MLNYELAKKLKDAGFTQRRGCSACLQGYAFENGFTEEKIGDDYVASPTLEDLIEACGNDLDQLENTMDGWRAYGSKGDEPIEIYWGKTPSEAVANLWLSLHTK